MRNVAFKGQDITSLVKRFNEVGDLLEDLSTPESDLPALEAEFDALRGEIITRGGR